MAKRAGVEAEAQPSSEGLTGGRLSGRQLQALFTKGAKVSDTKRRNQLALKLCEENQGPEQESTRRIVEQMAEQQRRETTGGQPLTFDIMLKDDEEQKAYLIDPLNSSDIRERRVKTSIGAGEKEKVSQHDHK